VGKDEVERKDAGVDKIVISGIKGYDGEYEFDASYFTNRELHRIKQMSGVRAGEILAAFAAGDNDLVVAVAAIALERNGKAVHEAALWDAKVGSIEVQLGAADEEEDALPPAPAPEDSGSESAKPASSGLTSNDGSETPANGQSRTGIQASELSAA
jgi:hypothetical protein